MLQTWPAKARIGRLTDERKISSVRLINNGLGRLIGNVISLSDRRPLAVADVALNRLPLGVSLLLLYVCMAGSYSRGAGPIWC